MIFWLLRIALYALISYLYIAIYNLTSLATTRYNALIVAVLQTTWIMSVGWCVKHGFIYLPGIYITSPMVQLHNLIRSHWIHWQACTSLDKMWFRYGTHFNWVYAGQQGMSRYALFIILLRWFYDAIMSVWFWAAQMIHFIF